MLGTIRLSTGRDTTPEEIDAAADTIIRSVKKLTPKQEITNGEVEGIKEGS